MTMNKFIGDEDEGVAILAAMRGDDEPETGDDEPTPEEPAPDDSEAEEVEAEVEVKRLLVKMPWGTVRHIGKTLVTRTMKGQWRIKGKRYGLDQAARKCQVGPNAGKPGPCPDGAGKETVSGDDRGAQSDTKESRGPAFSGRAQRAYNSVSTLSAEQISVRASKEGVDLASADPEKVRAAVMEIAGNTVTPPPPGRELKPDVEADSDGDGVTDAARVGVPATIVPPPPSMSKLKLPNLNSHERQVETEFAEAFEKDPDGFSDKFLDIVKKSTKEGEPLTFGTDDAKVLHKSWSDPSLSLEQRSQNRATLNCALHQTANAIAKRAFLKHLDSMKAGSSIMVTVGGCGAGKGYSLGKVPEVLAMKQSSGAVWDSAGDQNATENPWIQAEAEKRGLNVTYAFVHADPYSQWSNPERGVVKRAGDPKDGRMVDADVFADSYAIGAKNHQAFYEANKSNKSAKFVFLSNGKKIDGIPKEALSVDRKELADFARKTVKEGDAPPHVKQGATVGERIWGSKSKAMKRIRKAVEPVDDPDQDAWWDEDAARLDKMAELAADVAVGSPEPTIDDPDIEARAQYVVASEAVPAPEETKKRLKNPIAKRLSKGRPVQTDDETGVVTYIMTSTAEDRDGETVNPEGGDFTEFQRNPIIPFNHDTDSLPVGRLIEGPWNEEIGEGTNYDIGGPKRMALLGKVKFSRENPDGDLAYRMVKEGTLNGGSISFLPLGEIGKNRSGGNHYDRWKLIEFTVCPIGSNPDSVAIMKCIGCRVSKSLHSILVGVAERALAPMAAVGQVAAVVGATTSGSLAAVSGVLTALAAGSVGLSAAILALDRMSDDNQKKLKGKRHMAKHIAYLQKHIKKPISKDIKLVANKIIQAVLGGIMTFSAGAAALAIAAGVTTDVAAGALTVALTTGAAGGMALANLFTEDYDFIKSHKNKYKPRMFRPVVREIRGEWWIVDYGGTAQDPKQGPFASKEEAQAALDYGMGKSKAFVIVHKETDDEKGEFATKQEADAKARELGSDYEVVERSISKAFVVVNRETDDEKGEYATETEAQARLAEVGGDYEIIQRRLKRYNVDDMDYVGNAGNYGVYRDRETDKFYIDDGFKQQGPFNSKGEAMSSVGYKSKKRKKAKRKYWKLNNKAWLIKSDGPVDQDMEAYLEERGLDDVRLDTEEPPVEEGWEEREMPVEAKDIAGDEGVGELMEAVAAGDLTVDAAKSEMRNMGYSDADIAEAFGQKSKADSDTTGSDDLNFELDKCADDMIADGEKSASVALAKKLAKRMIGRLNNKRLLKRKGFIIIGPATFSDHYWDGSRLTDTGEPKRYSSESEAERDLERIESQRLAPVGPLEVVGEAEVVENSKKLKRLSKDNRRQLKEISDFLTDVADAGDTPKRLSAGMKFHAQSLKALTDDAPLDDSGDEVTDADAEMLERAIKSLQENETSLNDTLYASTGKRLR